MGQNNIIELNGKQYDAITGALIGESRIKATPVSRAPRSHQGRVIDGFVRKPSQTSAVPQVQTPTPKSNHATAAPAKPAAHQPKMADVRRAKPTQVKHHQPERSKTLMRHVVHKPTVNMKPAIKTTGPAEMIAKPASELATQLEKKVSVTQVNPVRLARASHVPKSHHIRKFEKQRYGHTPAQRPSQYNTATRPVRQDLRHASRPTPIASRSVALEQAAARLSTRQSANDLFEAALIHAASHEEPRHKPSGRKALRRKRMVSLVAGLGAFLVIGGFVTYLNMPGIELRVASVRAGFHAELPSYKPTGYALDGGVKASEGKVEVTYRSGDSSYKITQVASDWNSATLLDQNTEQRGAPTQTIQSEGRIIYIYDDNNASWVDGGVRYEVTGNANLNADDLVSLATSM
ncbi:MAG TPA: DUF4367 domain-containing protein [Candidatus Saccharimonadales bacterium]|nr:DUF4367 domain-containing protein [Candidatus Saccharimonadales bacterium]